MHCAVSEVDEDDIDEPAHFERLKNALAEELGLELAESRPALPLLVDHDEEGWLRLRVDTASGLSLSPRRNEEQDLEGAWLGVVTFTTDKLEECQASTANDVLCLAMGEVAGHFPEMLKGPLKRVTKSLDRGLFYDLIVAILCEMRRCEAPTDDAALMAHFKAMARD